MPFDSRDHSSLTAIARHGLPTGLAPPQATVALHGADVERVRMLCRTDRIAGLFAGAVQAGEVAVAARHVELIVDDWHQGLRACVLLEALLIRTAERLAALDVRWAVTKGSAIGHLDFPDPAQRQFGDVDLVVHPDDWSRVLDALGGAHPVRPRTRSFVHRFGKGETLVIDDMEIDLHLRFAVGHFGVRCEMSECFGELASFSLAGRLIPSLAAEYRLLHACFHAVLGGNQGFRAFRDIAQILTAHPDCVAPMWEVARRWQSTAVVATALVSTWEKLQLTPDDPVRELADAEKICRRDRNVLAVFANDRRFRPQAMTAVGALSLPQRLQFLLAAWQMSREARS